MNLNPKNPNSPTQINPQPDFAPPLDCHWNCNQFLGSACSTTCSSALPPALSKNSMENMKKHF